MENIPQTEDTKKKLTDLLVEWCKTYDVAYNFHQLLAKRRAATGSEVKSRFSLLCAIKYGVPRTLADESKSEMEWAAYMNLIPSARWGEVATRLAETWTPAECERLDARQVGEAAIASRVAEDLDGEELPERFQMQ